MKEEKKRKKKKKVRFKKLKLNLRGYLILDKNPGLVKGEFWGDKLFLSHHQALGIIATLDDIIKDESYVDDFEVILTSRSLL